MADVFPWMPTSQSGGTATGQVSRARFGDGYSQSVADGINPISRSYQLTFTGPKAQMEQIAAFLDAHVGRSFLWTPRIGGQGYYQCDGYSDRGEGGEMLSISTTFEQAFQP
ncbi:MULTISPECIES: phage tail protein [Xanthomonas]|uniref:phage tail protein n=1 Tax=Xanthomonas TaxID=338 RepID=UPI001ADB0EF8|nr:phage tail protein [Xanthomonas phaseoli]MBO9766522.1 phage tail protein [Xanthomonas phaseoli pv. dieffenbachiae]MBO9776133.1 phage tail protein [Xanthomonas phaseoli pv. dieffenbachiae]MBO9778269.1 phage tail protein [Xanthomonas phaseoli pv. dieffenbachiae]MBO9795343.1 phage tail protein [Xanthomonas phaseoli pv. dieffenbachiae]MBO9801462.1 phage tail protein [Xanthomonas phaseoli pv. dieffenbachiae]